MSSTGLVNGQASIRLTLVVLGALHGCVIVVPHVTSSYDPKCKVVAKHVELKPVQIAALAECRNEDCGALLVVAGVTAVGSAVISGSIAIVGNAVYWLEKQGNCAKPDPIPPSTDLRPRLIRAFALEMRRYRA